MKPLFIVNPRFGNGNINEPTRILVPCGKCEACKDNDSKQWRFRLNEEFNKLPNAIFLTLTYDDANVPLQLVTLPDGNNKVVSVVSKDDVQKFLKRLRRNLEKIGFKEKISYFLVSEYGPTTLRPHYHAIVFGLPYFGGTKEKTNFERIKLLKKSWNNGNIKLDVCNDKRINYVTKYVCQQTVLPDYLPKPFRLMSKKLGLSFLDKTELVNYLKDELTTVIKGNFKKALPRYLKDKIFNCDELDQLRKKNLSYLINEFNSLLNEAVFLGVEGSTDKEKVINLLRRKQINYKNRYRKNNIKNRKDI